MTCLDALTLWMCLDYILGQSAFWQAFLPSFVATVTGALLGIPIALAIDRVVSKRGAARAEAERLKRKNERALSILGQFRESLQRNRQLAEQISRELNRIPDIVFYNVDTLLLDATASAKYDLIDNASVNRQVDRVRYELQHLHRKVDVQFESAYSSFITTQWYGQLREQLIRAIRNHIPEILAEIDECLERLEEESTRLEPTRRQPEESF